MKILINAYACSPYKGSEPSVGWGFVSALAKHHDLWVIVEEEKFRADIERYLTEHPEAGQTVRFHFLRKKRRRTLRKLWPPSYYWYYRRWQLDALALAQKLHSQVNFDLVHQLTMVGFREPGYLWRLGIPFVWGPVGGMGLFPWRFLPAVGLYGAMYYFGYNLYNIWQIHFMRRAKQAAQTAGRGLIAMNMENARGFADNYSVTSEVCIPVGPPGIQADEIPRRTVGDEIRLVCCGQHKPGKALNLALEALRLLPNSVVWRLDLLGSGPMSNRWKSLASRLGILDRCFFHGWLARDEALQIMRRAHLQLFPSLREGTPSVIVEGFSLGIPIVCMDCCGMSDMVNEDCGIKIPLTTPAEAVKAFASAIERIAGNEDFRQGLARKAIERSRDFSWEDKIEVLDRIYEARIAEEQGDLG